jgi:serine/threonine protein kinase
MREDDRETMTTQTARCPRCGDSFPEGLDAADFEGICPNCLAFLAVDKDADVLPSAASEDPLRLAAKDPPPLKRGATFHGMELLEVIGQGGMGVVYKARQIELDRLVALKILPPRLAADPEFPRRFNREAQALASLDHSNIVRIHDVGREGELYFIVMEYVDGMNLRDLLVQKKLSPEQALRVVPQLCDALEYAHSRGVIHRDIKPENILLSRAGVAKIADFGLAKIVKDERAETSITQTNVVMGTADYMAPEQRDKTKAADHRADIYSLGVVFYELLTGELPVGRFDPPSHRKQVDGRLDDVVLKALEKDPERRYQRASHLGRDVDRITSSSPATPLECQVVDLHTGKRIGSAPGQRLAIHAIACPLKVVGWQQPHIGLEIDGDYLFEGESSTPMLQSHVETRSITLNVPKGVEIDAIVDEGGAEVDSVTGHVILKVPDGSVRVVRHDGALRIHGGEGSVHIDTLRSEYFEVRARSGSVSIVGLELARGRGQVETEGGSVTLEAKGTSSFRYYLETRGGSIDGPASGQVGAGTGWLTVRTGGGSIRFNATASPFPFLGARDFVQQLTAKQLEKLGKYVIVNIGLFLFFIFVAGTATPAIIIAIFWGIALGLELWKGYVRQGHRGAVPAAMQKVFNLVPTPLPDPPPPTPPARFSALSVLALLGAIVALLSAAGSGITMMVEGGAATLQITDLQLGEMRLGAFVAAAAAMALAIPSLLMGWVASSHIRESGGRLKGRGPAQVAVFFTLVAGCIVFAYVKPRLRAIQHDAAEARQAGRAFVEKLRDGKTDELRALLADPVKERYPDADLKSRIDRIRAQNAELLPQLQYERLRLEAGGTSAHLHWTLMSQKGAVEPALLLEKQGSWKVSNLDPFLKALGD